MRVLHSSKAVLLVLTWDRSVKLLPHYVRLLTQGGFQADPPTGIGVVPQAVIKVAIMGFTRRNCLTVSSLGILSALVAGNRAPTSGLSVGILGFHGLHQRGHSNIIWSRVSLSEWPQRPTAIVNV